MVVWLQVMPKTAQVVVEGVNLRVSPFPLKRHLHHVSADHSAGHAHSAHHIHPPEYILLEG